MKVNSVLMTGLNDDEAPDLLAWAVEHDYELRFIEQMPLDAQHGWKRDGMITAGDILASLRTRFELTPEGQEKRGSAPAERWLVDGGPHRVGVIASVTRPFCSACDRTRLTADGQVRTCLFATEETDLRAALRSGADDEEIARIWKLAMWGKKAGAASTTRPSSSRTARCPPSAAERPAAPAAAEKVSARGLQAPSGASHSSKRTTSFRKPRTPRNCARCSRCSSQASHVLRRSGVWIFGLFQASTHSAGARQPFAEQMGVSGSGLITVRPNPCPGEEPPREKATPSSHGELPGVGLSLRRGMRSAYEVCHGSPRPRHRKNMIDLRFL